MIFTTKAAGFRPASVLFAAALAIAVALPAWAHEGDHWPVTGDSLKLKSTETGKLNRFRFKTRNQVNINAVSIAEDPTVAGASLIVRGTGLITGNTGVVPLPAEYWKPIRRKGSPAGWKFRGEPYYSSGVSKIVIRTGESTGSLSIAANGFFWPLDIPGPQDSIEIVLTVGEFAFCAEFSEARGANFLSNEAGKIRAVGGAAPSECPAVCGNGVVEIGEECDDANSFDNDTCSNVCVGCNPSDAEFSSTFEGLQNLIFDSPVYNCTNDLCHGSAMEGGLDLRAGSSYANLVGVASQIEPGTERVFPGDQDMSVLWLKIAEKTTAGAVSAPGSPMPSNGSTVTDDHLEALRLWIRGGAPETGVVAGTAELLGSCLPSPTPLNIPQPPVPDPSAGTQFAMPGYPLVSQTEVEGCVASYYDVSASVPASMMVDCPGAFPGTNETGLNAGKCFSYRGNQLFQDAQSHHSIVHIYPGDYDWNDSGWGTWRCYGGPTPDAACNPTTSDPCGTGGVCGSKFHKGVACLDTAFEDWGAPDFQSSSSPQFSGSQESTADFAYPDGVYSVLPLKGLIVWNSHAFNLTSQDTDMDAWINITYTDTRTWPAQGLFDSRFIFVTDVPPFEQREYCATHTFPEGTRLFQLTSHTHKHGIRWRYYGPPQTPCSPGPSCTAGNPGDIFYESYEYSDPRTDDYVPPMYFTGTVAERTIKFCSLYDNGFNNPDQVKTQSGSPVPTGNLIFGGPCADDETYCNGGVNKGQLCFADDANCPGSVCDACTLLGGVTTEDEMFIAIGNYYVDP